jgi:hypothetical protein
MVVCRKILIVLLLLMFFAGLGSAIYLDLRYDMYLPREPDDKSGRVHRIIVDHGSVRYATQRETDRMIRVERWLKVTTACGMVAGIINCTYQDFPARRRLP